MGKIIITTADNETLEIEGERYTIENDGSLDISDLNNETVATFSSFYWTSVRLASVEIIFHPKKHVVQDIHSCD